MQFTRAMLAFVTVPALWAALVFLLGQRLVVTGDILMLTVFGFVAGVIWLAFVNMCVYVVRRGKPPTAVMYLATAVVGSGASSLLADLLAAHDLYAAVELSFGVTVLAALSGLLFVAIAGLPWRPKNDVG